MLGLAAFLAAAVEALTVVLAVGVTRGWRSSLMGAGTATLALAAVIAAVGPALALMPMDVVRVLVGTLFVVGSPCSRASAGNTRRPQGLLGCPARNRHSAARGRRA
jgi:uncharacterized membrane protein